MQTEYLVRLSKPLQQLICEVEEKARVPIQVEHDSSLNERGPLGKGVLEVEIGPQRVRLFAPSNGYFPDGAVFHEVSHVRRFHVDGVPQIVLNQSVQSDLGAATMFTELDNAIEHLVIVPEELLQYPERCEHWEMVLKEVWAKAEANPESERPLAACMHWTFMRHVLPNSPQTWIALDFLERHKINDLAEKFREQVVAALASKEEVIRLLMAFFPEKPWNKGHQRYFDCKSSLSRSGVGGLQST